MEVSHDDEGRPSVEWAMEAAKKVDVDELTDSFVEVYIGDPETSMVVQARREEGGQVGGGGSYLSVSRNRLVKELQNDKSVNGVPLTDATRLKKQERLAEIEPHVRGVAALLSPATGIVDYGAVARAYAARIEAAGHNVLRSAGLRAVKRTGNDLVLTTAKGTVGAGHLINCAGLHSDRVARLAGAELDARIVPFRGEYWQLTPEARHLCRALVYPLPDPDFPFLGVHFTCGIDGEIEAGPNAVLAFHRYGYKLRDVSLRDLGSIFGYAGFWRMAARYWRTAFGEWHRSLSHAAFTRALQKLMPELQASDLTGGGSGVRAQALDPDGTLADDFRFAHGSDQLHVLCAPSPAATASMAIGAHIAQHAAEHFGLRARQSPMSPSTS